MISYSFHPEAEAELSDAALFYESRVNGLGQFFLAEVQRIVALICAFPDAGAPIRPQLRRTLVDRFPYAVVYRHASGSVRILAVGHLRRRPGYWRRRK